MKEKRNLHQKVQEMCNCYATTDPLKSMSQMVNEDSEDAAVKWLALAALHGVNANAKKNHHLPGRRPERAGGSRVPARRPSGAQQGHR